MTQNTAFIFPGQGESHSVGMGKDFHDNFKVAKETFEEANDLLGYDLKNLIFDGPLEKLSKTNYCQIAIYVVSMVVLKVVNQEYPDLMPKATAGLSLGEYSAATCSGVIDYSEGVKLVHARGTYMQKACEDNPSTMAVVLGLSEEEVKAIVEKVSLPNDIWIANLNCPGQVVVTGTHKGVETFIETAKESKAKRVLPLNVAGAFHSPLMHKAQTQLQSLFDPMEINEPKCLLAMNAPGKIIEDLSEIRKNLILQITHSVRWSDCIMSLQERGIENYLELGCGKVLAGLNKRIKVSGQTLSINCVSDLESISSFLNA